MGIRRRPWLSMATDLVIHKFAEPLSSGRVRSAAKDHLLSIFDLLGGPRGHPDRVSVHPPSPDPPLTLPSSSPDPPPILPGMMPGPPRTPPDALRKGPRKQIPKMVQNGPKKDPKWHPEPPKRHPQNGRPFGAHFWTKNDPFWIPFCTNFDHFFTHFESPASAPRRSGHHQKNI